MGCKFKFHNKEIRATCAPAWGFKRWMWRLSVILTMIIFFGCNVAKNHKGESMMNGVVEYVNLVDTIVLQILFYSAGCECNETTVCASECIGLIDSGDTLRVLTLCNTSTEFSPNMKIKIAPQFWPHDIDTLNLPTVWVERNRHLYLHEIYRQRIKTTYGELILEN